MANELNIVCVLFHFMIFLIQILLETESSYNSYQGYTPYNGLYGEAPPDRGTIFRLQVYETVWVYSLKYTKGYGVLSFGSVKEPKRANR